MPSIAELASNLGKKVEDLSQLNVRTFSGDLNTVVGAASGQTGAQNNGGQGLSTDLSNIDALLKEGFTKGNLTLEACTIMNIDGDIDQFYSSNITPNLQTIHQDAVATGKETRQSIVDFVTGLVKDA